MNLFSTLFLLLILATKSHAGTLLLPEPHYDYEAYIAKCQKEGFICTTEFFLTDFQKKPTPQFDAFIDSIDLNSDLFIQNFSKNLSSIIKNEMISEEQLNMLLKLIEQVKTLLANNKQLELIESDLLYFRKAIETDFLKTFPDQFIILFKKPLSVSQFKKLNPVFIRPIHTIIHYDQVPQSQTPLFTGLCENVKISELLQLEKWQVLHSKSCSFSETISQGVSENKNKLIWGAVALGALLYLSKYEISLQF